MFPQPRDLTQDRNHNARISELFLTTMSSAMYFNLEKLASSLVVNDSSVRYRQVVSGTISWGRRQVGNDKMTQGLKRELYHLRDIGSIEVDSISSLSAQAPNLSALARITKTGQNFVSLRSKLERETSAVQQPKSAGGSH